MEERDHRVVSISRRACLTDFRIRFLNAFSKLSKPDRRFIDIRDRANKIDQDLSHVEKLLTKVVRKQSELVADYSDFEVQIAKLSALEPELTEPIAAFGAALNATSQEALALRDSADAGYLTSLNDMSAYHNVTQGTAQSA